MPFVMRSDVYFPVMLENLLETYPLSVLPLCVLELWQWNYLGQKVRFQIGFCRIDEKFNTFNRS